MNANSNEKGFGMTYDPEADAVMITFRRGSGRTETKKIEIPDHFIEIDGRHRLVAMEILNASQHYDRKVLEQLPDGTEWLTLTEAAEESGLAPESIRSAIRLGRLPAVKRGREWLVAGHELMTYLESRDTRGRKPARKPRRRRAPAKAGEPHVIPFRRPGPAAYPMAARAGGAAAVRGWVGGSKKMRATEVMPAAPPRAPKRSSRSRRHR